MVARITLLWIFGLITIVPYGTYHLFFVAEKDQYAFLITIILFWIFGFWGVVGPLISVYKIRRIMKTFDAITDKKQLEALIHSQDTEDVAIDLIAMENRIPKFLARKVYFKLVEHLPKVLEKERNRENTI